MKMNTYECNMILMEDVMFTSTEYGSEYKAYGLIGNTALPYALDFVPVHHRGFKDPQYHQHFAKLNDEGIFITPATFLNMIEFKLERYNCIPENYQLSWSDDKGKGRKSIYPDEGWWKMIRKGNTAVFYIFSEKKVKIPQYIRLGKFMSKCMIKSKEIEISEKKTSEYMTDLILRAEDIPNHITLSSFEKLPVPNSIYLKDTTFYGNAWELHTDLFRNPFIPKGCKFYVSEVES
jgi:CRISPR-associated protein Csc1